MTFRRLSAMVAAAVLGTLSVAGPARAISGGEPAAPGEFPWMVRLLPAGCGGTLIEPRLVLTAKHCIMDETPDSFTVVSGAVDLEDPARVATASVATYVTPGEWWQADWGLVKLAEPLDLPTVTLSADRTDPSTITAVGWGSTQWGAGQERHLRKVELPFRDDESCAGLSPEDYDDFICTSGPDRRSHCKGDSGGPGLRRLADGRWEQVGVVSHGSDCDWEIGEEPWPVFTDVTFFAEDIAAAAAELR